jgi:plasmid stability protein
MATLTIRNIDDDVAAALRARAKRHHRSLEAEVRHILDEAARGALQFDLVREAERIAAMTPDDTPQSDSVQLLREDRDR